MLNNFINRYDFFDVWRVGWKKACEKVGSRLAKTGAEIVAEKWSTSNSEPSHWWDIPEVAVRWNELISGDPTVDHCKFISDKYLSDRCLLNGLSLGCGDGTRELRWMETGKFAHLDAFDLSESQIQKAIEAALSHGYGNSMSFSVGDAFNIGAPDRHYDVVIVEHSLHHFSPMRDILLEISRMMKPNGFFIINEFVGPTRFQWSDRQLEATNGILSILPRKYKKLTSGEIKTEEIRTSRLRMQLRDPSEAVESAMILPLIREIFEEIEVREYGGTVLQLLFDRIAQNFLGEDPETKRWLKICFGIEDSLLASNELSSDFVVAICRPKG